MSTDYLKRYDENDPGLRFQDLVYHGNFEDMEPVPDGILGDKIMKSRAASKVLERVTIDDVRGDEFTITELNDLNNYLAWNIWDFLVMNLDIFLISFFAYLLVPVLMIAKGKKATN